ncbi:hypothetical protein [Microbacterium allomyrinae]|uniref:Right-handed parallel beta-helix repeat-containing protein n=1 Tax=Microbacterium allomyrinae TaxID=2830666 RepID=A0A9X1LTB6_9MICO|nr:hypothetical protein [Microbacterium allomyrinae]MCC2031584.1 hypothetical protein [Microbacterium allomyrinae]
MSLSRTITRALALALAAAGCVITVGMAGGSMPAFAQSSGVDEAPARAAASDTTYYVDNAAGSNCSDSGPGTSESSPWCTFTPANALTLGAGDSLLLARGDSWSQQLNPTLAGTANGIATIGAYGEGAAPRILATSTGIGLALTDPEYAVISNLDIGAKTSAGLGALSYGIMATYTSLERHSLTFSDLSVHDSVQIGILVRSTATQSVSQTALDGLSFVRVTTTHNAQGIATVGQGVFTDMPSSPTSGSEGSKTFTNVLLDAVIETHDDANVPLGNPGNGVPCAGLTLQYASNVVVRDSVFDTEGSCYTAVGTTAVFLGRVNHVRFLNNIVVNTPNTGSPDMCGIDLESMTNDVTIAGTYFGDNYGAAIEYLAIHGSGDFSTNHVVSSNAFYANGSNGHGAIAQLGGDSAVQVSVTKNVVYQPAGTIVAGAGGTTTGFTVAADNVVVTDGSRASQSAAQFGTAPWGYQSGTGSTWSALAYDSSTATYAGSGVAIGRFTLTPSSTSTAALTWTAPTAGTVSVRGYAVATAGMPTVIVSRNGTTVTSTAASTSGVPIAADGITVAAGDVLRFVVPAGATTVSWAPSVAYTS